MMRQLFPERRGKTIRMLSALLLAGLLLVAGKQAAAQLRFEQLRKLPDLDLRRLGYTEFPQEEEPPEGMQAAYYAKAGDSVLVTQYRNDSGAEITDVWYECKNKGDFQRMLQDARRQGFIFRKREGRYYLANGSYAWETVGFSPQPGDYTIHYLRHTGKELGMPVPANSVDTADPIRGQSYLQLRHLINCDSQAGDNLSARICANLAYQRSDSLMALTCDSLLTLARKGNQEKELLALQQSWRTLRDAHCSLAADGYQGHLFGIIYLSCLREMTDNRRRELQSLKRDWGGE